MRRIVRLARRKRTMSLSSLVNIARGHKFHSIPWFHHARRSCAPHLRHSPGHLTWNKSPDLSKLCANCVNRCLAGVLVEKKKKKKPNIRFRTIERKSRGISPRHLWIPLVTLISRPTVLLELTWSFDPTVWSDPWCIINMSARARAYTRYFGDRKFARRHGWFKLFLVRLFGLHMNSSPLSDLLDPECHLVTVPSY